MGGASEAICQALAENDELIPRESGQRVPGAEDLGQALGDRHEQLVPGLMAVCVVDVLEAVEIDEQHRGDALRASLQDGRVRDAFQQEDAVREPRQGVVKRGLPSLVGGRLEVGAGLSVEQVRGGDVRQRLGRVHCSSGRAPGLSR